MSSASTENASTRPAQPIAIDTTNASHHHHKFGGAAQQAATQDTQTPERRRRSSSVWSNPGLSTSSSPVSTLSGLQTPSSFSPNFTRTGIMSGSPPNNAGSSPIAYFFGSSPTASKGPANANGGSPFQWPSSAAAAGVHRNSVTSNDSAITEEDEQPSPLSPNGSANNTNNKPPGHFRASSMSGGGGSGASSLWGGAQDRAAGVMRRLSLSGALGSSRPARVPSPPSNNTAVPTLTHSQTLPQRGRDANPVVTEKKMVAPKRRAVSPMGERMLKGHFDGFGM